MRVSTGNATKRGGQSETAPWTPQSQQRARVTPPTLSSEQSCGQLREGTKRWPGIASPSFSADSYLRWLAQLLRKEAEAGD